MYSRARVLGVCVRVNRRFLASSFCPRDASPHVGWSAVWTNALEKRGASLNRSDLSP
jgi:hypothetical protein